jgi:hypothetical protein
VRYIVRQIPNFFVCPFDLRCLKIFWNDIDVLELFRDGLTVRDDETFRHTWSEELKVVYHFLRRPEMRRWQLFSHVQHVRSTLRPDQYFSVLGVILIEIMYVTSRDW